MSSCNLDHSAEDVTKKLEEQKPFLPDELYHRSHQFLKQNLDQSSLNELFHLLKKYDLASSEVKEERNERFKRLFASQNI